MSGVLLVDDVPGERANFEHAFGPDLTVAPSIDQRNDQLRRGLTWDIAFVDFNLSSQTSTGLTALLRLHQGRPATRIAFRFCFIYFSLYVLTTQMVTGLLLLPVGNVPNIGELPPLRNVTTWVAVHE